MRVKFFYQHFWPDSPPYANILRALGSDFVQEGISVSVVTGVPSYKSSDRLSNVERYEEIDGISVHRVNLILGAKSFKILRMLSKAIWPLRGLIAVLWSAVRGKRSDIIVAATMPPVINGLCGLLAARLTRAKFVYHLQDIYPEIGTVSGLWSETSLRNKILLYFDCLVCRLSDKSVVLSPDMANALYKRGVSRSKVVVINNIMLTPFETDSDSQVNARDSWVPPIHSEKSRFKLIFAGNLGSFQGLDNLLKAFVELPELRSKLELHFLGDGAALSNLLQIAKGHNHIYFHGHLPYVDASKFMSECDAGIVSIQPDVYRYAYPSKTMTYLGIGLPILAFVEPESSLAATILKSMLGVAASNRKYSDYQKGFVEIVEFLKSSSNDNSRIRCFASQEYSRKKVVNSWIRIFSDIQN